MNLRYTFTTYLLNYSVLGLDHEAEGRDEYELEWTGFSNRPWQSRQTGLISIDVTWNSGDPCTKATAKLRASGPSPFYFLFVTLSLAPFSPPSQSLLILLLLSAVSRLTYFNIWRIAATPGRRTNRPTWQMRGCQVAQSAPANEVRNERRTRNLSDSTNGELTSVLMNLLDAEKRSLS